MSKKKISLIIISSILSILLLSFLIGNTYSKYISTIDGNGIASVAKWSFKANGQTSTMETISLIDNVDQTKLINGKIAPGSSGQFEILIDATGCQVGLDYKVEFLNETNKPSNLKFRVGDTQKDTIKELESVLTGTINANDTQRTKSIIVEWYWPYQTGTNANQISQNDLLDTQNGIDISEYTFDVCITGTQVEPKA